MSRNHHNHVDDGDKINSNNQTQTDYHHPEKMVAIEPEPPTEETSAGEKICHEETHPPRENRRRTR
jgi:hypothetical protein